MIIKRTNKADLTVVIPATCPKYYMTFEIMFNVFGWCYVLQDIGKENLLKLRRKHCLSVFGTVEKHPPRCLYWKSRYTPQCPPTNLPSTNTSYCDTLIIPSCIQPIPNHEYVMSKNESYSHRRRPAANKYNLSITNWPVKNYGKPTEANGGWA